MPHHATLPAFALAGLLLAWVTPAPAQVLRVCLNDEAHPPWRLADQQGRMQRQGLDFAFLEELQQRTGVQLQIAVRPGSRCLRELGAGEQDAMLGISHLPEREALVRYPGPPGQPDPERAIRTIEYVWYVLRDSPLRWDGEHLHGLQPTDRVGAQRGYAIAARLRAQHMRVDEGPLSLLSNLEMLRRGRVAALAVHAQAAAAVLAQQPELQQALRPLSPALAERRYYLVFSHRFVATQEPLAQRLWQEALVVRDSERQRLQTALGPHEPASTPAAAPPRR